MFMSLRNGFGAALPLAFLSAALSTGEVQAQDQQGNYADCKGLWFSTSEDFRSRNQGASLGHDIVSDGDLLAYVVGSGSYICARNEDLLRRFDIERYDHGLDALDQVVIDAEFVVAAFSTELDSMHSAAHFTAGDLLFSTGAIIPNQALLVNFNMPRSWNLGLDAVTIEGTPRGKRELLEKLSSTSRDQLLENPGILIEILEGTDTDILFSTEGTPPEVDKPQFLDGDLLSAKNGTIVRSNADLLPALPAGLPDRGVDYGLDAYTPAMDPIERVPVELLSIEINARDGFFSESDLLQVGPGIYLPSETLVQNFEPFDTDMGLDALAARFEDRVEACEIRITTISDIDVVDINPVTGLFDTDRPFGSWVRIQGVVPNDECPEYSTHEFQVQVTFDSSGPVPVLHPASQNWRRHVAPCITANDVYESDSGAGWFALTDYWRFGECPDDASLAMWNSTTSGGADFAEFRVVMRPIGGGVETSSAPVRIRLDNIAPSNMLAQLYNSGEMDPFGDQCHVNGGGEDIVIDIKGSVYDDHFSNYSLYWTGGDVHTWRSVPVTVPRTYNSRPELSDTGTEPQAATDVMLGTLNLSDEYAVATGGLPIIECGYTVRMIAADRSHRGRFTPQLNAFSHIGGNTAEYMQSFCLKP